MFQCLLSKALSTTRNMPASASRVPTQRYSSSLFLRLHTSVEFGIVGGSCTETLGFIQAGWGHCGAMEQRPHCSPAVDIMNIYPGNPHPVQPPITTIPKIRCQLRITYSSLAQLASRVVL